VDSLFRRKSKPIHPKDIGSLAGISLLGEQLKPIIEESLRECGKANYRKGTILTAFFPPCGFGIGHLARFELSPRHRLVGLRAVLVDLLFIAQVGGRRRAQSYP